MFNLFNKPTTEVEARAYCRAINADPDAMVWGKTFGGRLLLPRWQWYVAAPGSDRSFSVSR